MPVPGGSFSRLRFAYLVLTLGAAASLSAAAATRHHIVWERETGTVAVWNNRTATIFIPRQQLGWSGTSLEWGWQYFRGWMGVAAFPPSRRTEWQTILTIRLDAVSSDPVTQQTRREVFRPRAILDGFVVGNVGNAMRRWNGQWAVPLDEPVQRFFSAPQLVSIGETPIDGWHGRMSVFQLPDRDYPMRLNDTTIELIVRRTGHWQKELLLRAPGQGPRRVWFLDESDRHVDEAEFERLLTPP
jgi:hypothetical protein